MRHHAEEHAKALQGSSPEMQAHVAQHMRDHMKLHQRAQAEAQAAIHRHPGGEQGGDPKHERDKYHRPALAIDVEDLFEDMTEEEYEEMRKEAPKGSGETGGGRSCRLLLQHCCPSLPRLRVQFTDRRRFVLKFPFSPSLESSQKCKTRVVKNGDSVQTVTECTDG